MLRIIGGITFKAMPKLTGTNIDSKDITTIGSPKPMAPLHKPPTKKAVKINDMI